MTVNELIKKLQEFPPETIVLVWDSYCDEQTTDVHLTPTQNDYFVKAVRIATF